MILTDTEVERAEAATRLAIEQAEQTAANLQKSHDQAMVAGIVTVVSAIILHLLGLL